MKITEKLQHQFALSHEGAVDMEKACASVTVTNIALMMPAGVLYLLIKDLLNDTLTKERIPFYVIASIVILVLIALTNFIQYNATFLSTYKESGVRRTTLAEHLRNLPLSYLCQFRRDHIKTRHRHNRSCRRRTACSGRNRPADIFHVFDAGFEAL